jgi:hypothetical protein
MREEWRAHRPTFREIGNAASVVKQADSLLT